MIVTDLEMSGLDPVKCGIFEIGAVDLETGEEFLDTCRIDDEDILLNVLEEAAHVPGSTAEAIKTVEEVTGRSEAQMRDSSKQSQKELLEKFFKWIEERKFKNLVCQNPQFDVGFLDIKARKYGLKKPFHFRSFDLHSIAQAKYYELNGRFLIKGEYSNMGLKEVLKFVGMEDTRGAHNALEDAKLTAEAFSRIVYGKGILSEYEKFPIPDYLKQGAKGGSSI